MNLIKCTTCKENKSEDGYYISRNKRCTICKKCHYKKNRKRLLDIRQGIGVPVIHKNVINKKDNLVGKRFDNLTAISLVGCDKSGHRMWLCKCDCGKECNVLASNLKRGKQLSCGCIKSVGNNNANWKGYENISGRYLSSLKANAKKRKIPFNISLKYMWELYIKQDKLCALSGIPLIFSTDSTQTASLDRINSKLGYIKDNVQWVHKNVNAMKSNFDELDFIALCKQIVKYKS